MLEDLWAAALKSEVGIAISTDDRSLLRHHLYKARSEANNPESEEIVMVLPQKEDEIWLVKKSTG
jgi:DNA-binding phage protein